MDIKVHVHYGVPFFCEQAHTWNAHINTTVLCSQETKHVSVGENG